MTEPTTPTRHFRRSFARAATIGVAVCAMAIGFAGGRYTLSASATPPAATPRAAAPAVLPAVTSYSGIVEQVAPAVVTVRVEKQIVATAAIPEQFRDFFGPQFRDQPKSEHQSGLGSGVIFRADGYILTNNHVISDADRIRVDMADGRSFPAKLVGTDPASDLAVIHIDAKDLPTLAFGDSDAVKVGDLVLAFGNPLGVGQTVTMGIVSAKSRTTGVGDGNYEDFLQTDAPINQGNSGGALVNMRGELVGINAQILSPSGGNIGLGFAIPSGMAHAVTTQLIDGGVVHRSKLGVTVQPVTSELAESLGMEQARGALVSAVEPGSPAARAGLEQGDVITGLNGHEIADANALRNQIASTHPDTSVTLSVLRNGKTESLSARLAEMTPAGRTQRAANEADPNGPHFGMTVTPVTPSVAQQLDLPRAESGLAVTDVDPDGTAASAGVAPGDVIKSVNGHEVKSVADLRAALDGHGDRPALVLLSRQGVNHFVALPQSRS